MTVFVASVDLFLRKYTTQREIISKIDLAGFSLRHLEKLENELHIFYKIFVILYADDMVISSETKEGMQQALDIHLYLNLIVKFGDYQ